MHRTASKPWLLVWAPAGTRERAGHGHTTSMPVNFREDTMME